MELAQSSRTDWMPFGFQPTRGVDWYPAANGEVTALGRRAAFTKGHQHQRFRVEDLSHGGGVMHLRHVDIARGDAGLLEGLPRGKMRNDLVRLINAARAAGLHHTCQYTYCPAGGAVQALQAVTVAENDRSRPIADRRAHQQRERIGD